MFNLLGTFFIYTRVYTSIHFGYFAIFMGITSIISVISAARYEPAIVLPKEKADGFAVLILSMSFVAITSSLVFIIIFTLINFFPNTIYIDELGMVSFLIPFSILFFGLYQAINFWLIRNKRFKIISVAKVTEAVIAFGVTATLGFLLAHKFGIIIGYVSGQFVVLLYVLASFLKSDLSEFKTLSVSRMRHNAKIFIDFPRYNLLQVFVDMLQKYGSVFIIERFFGYSILGNYHLAYRILRGPLGLVGLAFSQVFYQKIAELYNLGENYYKLLKTSVLGLTALSIPTFTVVFLFIRPIFDYFLGEGYEECGLIAQILVPWIALNFISSPISTFPQILGKQREFLIITTIGSVVSLSFLYSFSSNGSNYALSLVAFSGAMMLSMAYIILWNLYLAKKEMKSADL